MSMWSRALVFPLILFGASGVMAQLADAIREALSRLPESAHIESAFLLLKRECPNDSLTKKESEARLAWIVRCEDRIPVSVVRKRMILEFLLMNDSKGMKYYPSFGSREEDAQDRFWHAPTIDTAPCEIPSHTDVVAWCPEPQSNPPPPPAPAPSPEPEMDPQHDMDGGPGDV